MTKELGLRLRSLRRRARLTQSELVKLVWAPTDRPDKEQVREFAGLALDGLDRQLRRNQRSSLASRTSAPGC
jgi:DNA-binding response OmpR family regulator